MQQRGSLRCRLKADDCDCVIACYLHLARKHLPAIVQRYPGDTGLTEWCVRSLRGLAGNRHRRIDFVRTGHTCAGEGSLRLRVPRLRLPECLRAAPGEQQELYRLFCRGKSVEELAAALRLPVSTVQTRIEALRALLAEQDWDAYIEMLNRRYLTAGAAIKSLTEPEEGEAVEWEPAAAAPSIEQKWALREAANAIARWIRAQSDSDQELLRLYVYEGRSAGEIVSQISERPGGSLQKRQVYSRMETLLNRMHGAAPRLLSYVDTIQPSRKQFVENLPYLLAMIETTS